tara:strand:- start:137 stop:898 length:762 start_codon:yes stop_codon:yes gene_type:complete
MRVLDLFSGIGGFSLGLEACGMTTTAFCERDPYCQSILKKHWPKTPVYTDVRNLDGKQYQGSVDVVAGGFPCQPFSVAGKRLGSEDDRHLWPEMLRIIRECRPRWVIGENVSGFIKMALDSVSSDLEGEGYAVRAFVLPAVAVDALHRRDRCFIVAHKKDVADTYHKRSQGRLCRREDSEWKSELGHSRCSGSAHGQPREKFWATQPRVCRVVDGVPNRVDRIKSLGNAVVPQLIQTIGELVLAADKEIYAHE